MTTQLILKNANCTSKTQDGDLFSRKASIRFGFQLSAFDDHFREAMRQSSTIHLVKTGKAEALTRIILKGYTYGGISDRTSQVGV